MAARPVTRRPSRGDLLDAAFRTAVDYVAYRRYEAEAGALASLRRRCRGFTPAQYRGALRRAVRLLAEVEPTIAPFDPPYVFESDKEASRNWTADAAARALQRKCPGFRLGTCRSAIWWTLLWYHWK